MCWNLSYWEEVQCSRFCPGCTAIIKEIIIKYCDLAKHSETLEDMVVYQALYGERGIWVRPASMWNEIVNYQGKQVKRFTYIETE